MKKARRIADGIIQAQPLHVSNTKIEDHYRPTLFDPLTDHQLQSFRRATILFYAIAYLYITAFFDDSPLYFFPIAIGLVGLVEFLSNQLEIPFQKMNTIGGNKIEASLFAIITLGQALVLSIWGFHFQLEVFQYLALHLSFIFYVLARTGWLVQGRLGIMVWFDSIRGTITLPLRHFLLALQILRQKPTTEEDKSDSPLLTSKFRQVLFILISLSASCLLVLFVWSQLSQVSQNFAAVTNHWGTVIEQFFETFFLDISLLTIIIKGFLSFPIAWWLYGLITGGLLHQDKTSLTYQSFHQALRPLQIFPPITAYILIGSLCLTYALFFVVGISEVGQILETTSKISPQDASTVAVAGFWQLVRVALLNFGVLAAFYFVSKRPLWDQKGTRIAITVLFVFTTLLALLASWKLFGLYIFFYGPTPLRLLSGWFILVLLAWCLLALVRFYKPIQAIRFGIFYALISFTLLCYLYPLFIL
ncbi:DUF4153 domain-containing protein [Streptococcus ovis]|uniref:DUF4153 domain-containing protein n=1 Tax=Streptococcus ovis TaxID=82806 RepID=UPI0003803DD7